MIYETLDPLASSRVMTCNQGCPLPRFHHAPCVVFVKPKVEPSNADILRRIGEKTRVPESGIEGYSFRPEYIDVNGELVEYNMPVKRDDSL